MAAAASLVMATALLLAQRTCAVTIRNMEPVRTYRHAFRERPVSVMRPPPPPSWPHYQDDIRSIRSNFAQNLNSFVPPPPHPPPVDATSRRPQQFADSFASGSSEFYSLAEPDVQVTQSIEASEHHSIYRLPPSDDVIRITSPPVFNYHEPPQTLPTPVQYHEPPLIQSTPAPDKKKRATLKDVLVEDCPNAKEAGYCASPPRYPSNQVTQIMARCSELLPSLYAPVPEDEEEEVIGDADASNTTSVERGNRQVWSWAHPGQSHQTVCESERQRIEPGYVLETKTGRWYVVLQAGTFIQRVATDKCRNTGKPCTATKCSRSSGFRNNTAKASRCVQRYSYSHLVTWDPDKPELCPRIRAFKFPTACVCYLMTK